MPSRAVHLSMRKTQECTANRTAKDVFRRRQGMIDSTNSLPLPECFRARSSRAWERCFDARSGRCVLTPPQGFHARQASDCARGSLWMISGQNAAIRARPSAVRSRRRLPEGVPQSWRPREHALELGQVGKGAPRGLARPNEKFIFLSWLFQMAGAVGSDCSLHTRTSWNVAVGLPVSCPY